MQIVPAQLSSSSAGTQLVYGDKRKVPLESTSFALIVTFLPLNVSTRKSRFSPLATVVRIAPHVGLEKQFDTASLEAHHEVYHVPSLYTMYLLYTRVRPS